MKACGGKELFLCKKMQRSGDFPAKKEQNSYIFLKDTQIPCKEKFFWIK
ncbi:hypothetical protein H9X84_12505 [Anaerotignum lactatifermentans]|nr:hypothetical protein [Anaerotignum lactatifermentans]